MITAELQHKDNRITITALVNPPDVKDESPVYNQNTPPPAANRIPYAGNMLTVSINSGGTAP